jgi:hypothetical protein
MARAAANKAKDRKTSASPPFERVALLLQGGGALGAYQGGVYQALAEANVLPTWIAGISIGAVNSAIIAGNAPENRVARLREFWEAVSSSPLAVLGTPFSAAINKDNQIHRLVNQLQALRIALLGAPSFFTPRFPPPSPWAPQDPRALSFYDVSPLHATLERLVDFDRINSGEIRFSVGATNVQTGDFAYFDNTTHKIEARHIVASGSLPPGFPATEVDGEYYWGRRARLEHAAPMGARQPPALRHARLPSRPMELVRRAAARPDPSRRAPEGNPVREPDAVRDRPFPQAADASPHRPACYRAPAAEPSHWPGHRGVEGGSRRVGS